VIENIKGGTAVASVDSGISSGADSGGGEEIEAWEGLDPGMVRSQVRDTTASLIGLDEDSFFDDTPLMDSGMDSLSSVEFRNQLAKDFQMNLPATLTFDYPSIKSLIQHIVETSKSAPPPEHLRVKSTANKSKPSVASPKEEKQKVKGKAVSVVRPCIVGSWDFNGSTWTTQEMPWDQERKCYTATMRLGRNGWESFQILCEGDWEQALYPERSDGTPHEPCELLGPDDEGHGKNWTVGKHPNDKGNEGVCFEIRLFLKDDGCAEKVDWVRLSSGDERAAALTAAARSRDDASYGMDHPFLVGTWNNWGAAKGMVWDSGNQHYEYRLQMTKQGWESFQILFNGEWKRCLHPDKKDACPYSPHAICGPDEEGNGKNWSVGRHPLDRGGEGVVFLIRLYLNDDGSAKRVDWVRG